MNRLRFGTLNSVDVNAAYGQSNFTVIIGFWTTVEYFVDDVLQCFGDQLRAIRLRKGISQEKLAEIAGVHRTFVSSVERGERNISLLNIARLAKALDVPMTRLFSS